MSLLGVDVGTTGCKAAAFSESGAQVSAAYEEYDFARPAPGRAELDPRVVWQKVKVTIARAAAGTRADPVRAVAVSSLGESVVPLDASGGILGPSILLFDERGAEYLPELERRTPVEELYRVNGNIWGNAYTLTKLMWLRDREPGLWDRTAVFLHWSGFVSFMLGAAPHVDYSLANRTLLFDLDGRSWSGELARRAGVDLAKLPPPVPSARPVGAVGRRAAAELGLPEGAAVVSGAHDQCANAVGTGVVGEGVALCSMGTYLCVAPAFSARPPAASMIPLGLNTEHHAAPGRYVSFLYNHGGSIAKWFRDTFAAREKAEAAAQGEDVYDRLFAEVPERPSDVLVLPHFSQTGPPEFVADSSGVITGLRLETTRGEILKGIMQSVLFYVRELVDGLTGAGVPIAEYRAVGGGAKSRAWVQMAADVLGAPVERPPVAEAGCLGAAVAAGVGCGLFAGFAEGVAAMVRRGDRFEPRLPASAAYDERRARYRELWPVLRGFLRR